MTKRYLTVDVLDSGTITGEGPLINIIQASVVQELDKAGSISITIPATDQRFLGLYQQELELHIQTPGGRAAAGILQNARNVPGNVPTVTLTGLDLLGELNYLNTGQNRVYDNAAVDTAIIGTTATATSLLGGTGWTQGSVSIEADSTPHTITYNGSTRLAAILELAKELGHHFRQGTTLRTLDFGVFGADSGIRIINLTNAGANVARDTDQAYVGKVELTNVSGDIENTIFPLGANGFDLRDAVTTDGTTPITDIYVRESQGPRGYATTADDTTSGAVIPVTATTGFVVGDEIFIGDADDWTQDHETGIIESISAATSITLTSDLANTYNAGADVLQRPQFYIFDNASVTAYGTRESYPAFSWIGPGDKAADASIQEQAAASLYLAARAHLTRYKEVYQEYKVSEVLELPLDLTVGQKVRIRYIATTGVFSGTKYVDIDDDFYVLKITRTFSNNTGPLGVCTLDVANVTRPMPNNANILVFNISSNRWLGLR